LIYSLWPSGRVTVSAGATSQITVSRSLGVFDEWLVWKDLGVAESLALAGTLAVAGTLDLDLDLVQWRMGRSGCRLVSVG
jgi:hypothetical protein